MSQGPSIASYSVCRIKKSTECDRGGCPTQVQTAGIEDERIAEVAIGFEDELRVGVVISAEDYAVALLDEIEKPQFIRRHLLTPRETL